jgi:hypothetical protein
MGFQFERQYLQHVEHLPTQQDNGKPDDHNSQYLSQVEAVPRSFKTPQSKAYNIKSGKSKNDSPEDVIDVLLLVGILKNKHQKRMQGEGVIKYPPMKYYQHRVQEMAVHYRI